MADVSRLKKKAAEYEAKRQFDRAIGVYEQIVRALGNSVREGDVPLFNRLGDLYLRTGHAESGIAMHEKAVDLYAELGFFNNAIALCNKILRQAPDRASIYYKLGKISAKKGFISDAKQNFLEYSARMQKAGQMDEAFRALKEFADLCPDQDDVRLMLAEQLTRAGKPQEALEQLQRLHEQLHGEGRDAEAAATAERIRALDPSAEPRRGSAPAKRLRDDLIFLDLNEGFEGARDTAPVEGLEPTSLTERVGGEFSVLTPREFGAINAQPAPPEREREQRRNYLDGLPLLEDYDARYLERDAVEKLQTEEFEVNEQSTGQTAQPVSEQAMPEAVGEYVQPEEVSPQQEEQQSYRYEDGEPASYDEQAIGPEVYDEQTSGSVAYDEQTAAPVYDEQAKEPGAYGDAPAQAAYDDQAEEPPAYGEHAAAPVEHDEQGGASPAYDEPLPAPVAYEAQVESESTGRGPELVEPGSDQFDAAFEALTSAPAADEEPPEVTIGEQEVERPPVSRSDDEYIDLGEWLRRVQTPRSTRMVTDEGEIPPEGEQADFEEMLEKFKRGIAQNMDAEDYGSHYDLGVAFREMGLLDEAIAQFQKALRGREHRVATFEALGQCFVDKRQYEVAVTVLQRALREPGFEDERGLGVLYLLGLANERMVRHAEAARYYQRVFSVDVHFRDIAERRGAVAQAAG